MVDENGVAASRIRFSSMCVILLLVIFYKNIRDIKLKGPMHINI